MLCILRIGGAALDIDAVRRIETVRPYRTEVKGRDAAASNCLYYDVADEESSDKHKFFQTIIGFLTEHRQFLTSLQIVESAGLRELDVALMFKESAYSSSLKFDPALLSLLNEFGLSLIVSIYRTSEEPQS